VTVTKKGDKASSKKVTKLSPKKTPSKEKKETLQKKYAQQAEAIYVAYPRQADRKNSIRSITLLLESGIPPEILLAAVSNYKSYIKREGTQPKFLITSKNFFGGRWEEFKEGSVPQGMQTGERNSYPYKKCPECGFEANSVELDKEGNLKCCVYCTE
jgi:hypothetical protein